MRRSSTGTVVLAATATAGATLAYASLIETRMFRLRRVEAPVLPAGQRALRVLHLTDLHLRPEQGMKRRWITSLAGLEPDLVVCTGDNLASPQAPAAVLDALAPLLDVPGVFVFGSNDYYGPRPRNPARYLVPGARRKVGPPLPWRDLRDGFLASGWNDLTHARATLTLDGRAVELRGVDDPHLSRDRYDEVAGPPAAGVDLAVGVVHAPYRRVLDAMVSDDLPLIVAGHTHGGQLRVPGYGAIVTNCDLPRQQARGLSLWPPPEIPAKSRSWLHVSAGLGCSPYAMARFCCPPEATLMTLVARGAP